MSTDIKVWKLAVVSSANNSHGIDLKETWKPIVQATFTDEKEAKDYIRGRTRSDPDTCGEVAKFLINYRTEEEKTAFLNTFCFDESQTQYAFKRRFFLTKPTKAFVKKMAEDEGLQFVNLGSK